MSFHVISLTRREALRALGGAALASPGLGFQGLYYGKDEPLPKQIELAAGPLTMVFEPDLGFLRYIRLGDTEILRGIYSAVRDRNWGTVAPRVSNVRVESTDQSFKLTFDVDCIEGPVNFFWRGTIQGEPAGVVRFQMDGKARSTFHRNRIGFCVLHPLKECVGKMCTVAHKSGAKTIGKFPQYVSPNQPFQQIASMSHEVAQGLTAEVQFDGEVFEMEDHRNWTDANFKTYCTPLDLPFPVEVPQGTEIHQAVTVTLRGPRPTQSRRFSPRRKETTLELMTTPQNSRPMPRVGFGLSLDQPTLDARLTRLIAAAKPAHLRVDVKLSDAGYPALLQRANKEALATQAQLEVAIHKSGNAEVELDELAKLVAAEKLRVARWLVFHVDEKSTSARWVSLARLKLRPASLTSSFGAGTNAYFAELNRERPEAQDLDFLTYSLNPQVHAFDNQSMVENLAAQADSVDSARQFSAGRQIVVSPVTFKPRFNPNATGAIAKPSPDVLPSQVDPRQLSLFGAAWTTGSLKYLSESGAAAVTYFETHGPTGLVELATGSKWPKLFPSQPNMVFPLYHVLADFNEFAGGEVLRCRSSQPLVMDGVVLRRGPKMRILVANLSAEPQAIRVAWPNPQRRLRIRKLDEHSFKDATQSAESWRTQAGDLVTPNAPMVELSLAAYGVARIDSAEA